jgi:hypothetical protein
LAAILVVAVASFGVLASTAAGAEGVPRLRILDVDGETTTSATVEMGIAPEDSATTYEFFLECESATDEEYECGPLSVGPERIEGVVPASLGEEKISAAFSGLQPGYLYQYRVIATNAAGKAGIIRAGFQTCPAVGTCPGESYRPGISLAAIESGERAAAETLRMQRELEARERETKERVAREAAEIATRERQVREADERAARAEAALARRECVVPRLKGDSLPAAVRGLVRAHCSLGHLTRPKGERGALVVVRQGSPVGKRLAPGRRVALTLGD